MCLSRQFYLKFSLYISQSMLLIHPTKGIVNVEFSLSCCFFFIEYVPFFIIRQQSLTYFQRQREKIIFQLTYTTFRYYNEANERKFDLVLCLSCVIRRVFFLFFILIANYIIYSDHYQQIKKFKFTSFYLFLKQP